MKPKKRLTRKNPGYFIPLPYAMALKRLDGFSSIEHRLFQGMQLNLRVEGLINITIAVEAVIDGERHLLGYIPAGMVSRVEGILAHEDNILVTLERKSCHRLKNMFWICFDELPGLDQLGL